MSNRFALEDCIWPDIAQGRQPQHIASLSIGSNLEKHTKLLCMPGFGTINTGSIIGDLAEDIGASAGASSTISLGRAARFEGDQAYTWAYPSKSSYELTESTILAIVRIRSVTGFQNIIGKWIDTPTGNDSWILRLEDNVLKFYVGIGGTGYSVSWPAIEINKDYVIIGTFSSASRVITLYVNGIAGTTAIAGGTGGTSSISKVRVGRAGLQRTDYFVGDIAAVGIIQKRLTPLEAYDLSKKPYEIFEPPLKNLFFTNSSVSQTLTPTTLVSSPTFYSPTVTPGAVTLTTSTLVSTPTFYTPTVSLGVGPQTLTPSTLISSPTFYSPIVTSGSVTLTPSTLVNAPTFYNPTISLGSAPQNLIPSTLISAPTFYAPTITPGAVTLTPSTIVNSPTFYSPTVNLGFGTQTLTPNTLVNSPTFYSPTVTAGAVTLTTTTLINIPTFYNPTVYIPSGQESINRTFLVPAEVRLYNIQPENRNYLI
jgi:hypothetical protein